MRIRIKKRKLKKNKHYKRLISFFENTKLMYTVLLAFLLLLVVPFFIVFFRLDQQFIKTSMEGYVMDSEGRPVTDAVIVIQEKEAMSSADGYYRLEGLTFGKFDISISRNGYHDYNENISLKRFSNKIDYTLDLQEFGEMKIFLSVGEENTFIPEEFVIAINDQLLDIERDLSVDTGKLLIGNYLLTIKSPFYEDYSETVHIDPGYQELTIELNPASEILGEITNWLSGEELEPDKVEIKTEEVFVELRDEYIDGNRIALENLNVSEPITIKIEKEGYLTLEKEINLDLGLNSIGDLALVPEGKIPLLSIEDGLSKFQVANYDGSDLKTVHTVNGSCSLLITTKVRAAYKCANVYYTVDLKQAVLLASVGSDSDIDSFDLFSTSVFEVYPNAVDKIILKNADGTHAIYSENEVVTSVGVSESPLVLFTASNSVWKMTKEGRGLTKISDGIFMVASINRGGTKMLLYNDLSEKQRNIWLLDNSTGEKTKLTTNSSGYRQVQFYNSNDFVYLDGTTLHMQSTTSTSSKELNKNVSAVTPIFDTSLLLLTIEDEQYLVHLQTLKTSRISK